MTVIFWTKDLNKYVNSAVLSKGLLNGCTITRHTNVDTLPPSGEGDIVLALGNQQVKALSSVGIVPKNRTIGSLRGKPIDLPSGAKCFVSYSPSIGDIDPSLATEFQIDMALVDRFIKTGSLKPVIGFYEWADDFSSVVAAVDLNFEVTGKPTPLALDLETVGLNPYDSEKHIVSIFLTYKVGHAVGLYFGPFDGLTDTQRENLEYLLNTPKVRLRGANLKYDLVWMRCKWNITSTNFSFDTFLVGSLLDENRCVAPETLILTSDLKWVRADSLQSGDSVVGFDENGDQGTHRRMRKSLVVSSEVIQKKRLKLNLSNGHSVVVSDNHQFLCKKYPSTHVKVWRKAKNIQSGCVIFSATPHPHDIQGKATDYELGRLSGFLDGEGSVPKLNDFGSWHLGWGQIPHSAHQDMKRISSLLNAEYREHDDNLNLCKSVVFKGAWNSLHALIATRPLRLVAKEPWDNGPLPRGDEAVSVSVISVEDLGFGSVVALETTTHTFIAEGLLSHNSNSLKVHAKVYTCLSRDTEVALGDGTWCAIGDLVKSNYAGSVLSYHDGKIQPMPVVGWITNQHTSGEWLSVKLSGVPAGYGRFTPDHEFCTARGNVRVDELKCTDEVFTGFTGFADASIQVLLGSLLGDGGIECHGAHGARLALYQDQSREDYLQWKAGALGVPMTSYHKPKSSLVTYRGAGAFSVALRRLWERLQKVPGHAHNAVVPTTSLLTAMGPLGLAVWYQDDGHRKSTGRVEIRATIPGYEGEALAYLRGLFGSEVTYHTNGCFYFGGASTDKFFEYIRGYAHPAFAYKYPYPVQKAPVVTPTNPPLTAQVSHVHMHHRPRNAPRFESYCLTVAGSHNFVTRQGVVRNCLGGYEDDMMAAIGGKAGMARMDLVPKDVLIGYAGGDTDATLRVSNAMLKELNHKDNANLRKFYTEILHPACRAYEDVEFTGLLVDREYYLELKHEIEVEIEQLTRTAHEIMGGRLIRKYADNPSITRAALLKDFMFGKGNLGLKPVMFTEKPDKHGNPVPSTSLDHLMKFKDSADGDLKEFIKVFGDYQSATKTLSTYVDGFMKHLREDDRFHSSYFLANTGGEGGTDCMVPGTPVLTQRGYLPVEQVQVGDFVISHMGQPREVVATVDNGVHPVVQVRLANGLSLTTTKNHAYATREGWQFPLELQQGASVMVHSSAEQWAPVAGWEGYTISTWGRVRNSTSLQVLALQPKGKWGHLRVSLVRGDRKRVSGNRKDFAVHRLVALAFVPNPQEFPEVRHLNGIAWDNTVENLVWGTMCWQDRGIYKLTPADVQRVRLSSMGSKKLGKLLDVSDSYVRRIRRGEAWQPSSGSKLAKFSYSAVESVTELPPSQTYGLTVAVDSSHVTAGVVTHNTGRTSVRDPAIQTYPKNTKWAKKLRKAIIAPPGYSIVSADYSQGELRIAACFSGDETMLSAYQNGLDLHAVTGAGLAGYTFEDFLQLKKDDKKLFDYFRQAAKACFAKGSLVQTDQGDVPIEDVTTEHKVWDGIEWVNHDGVVYQGERFVMTYEGITATPEHVILTEVGAMPLFLAAELGLRKLEKSIVRNGALCFFYSRIESRSYLKGKLHDSITTESIVAKAREYGFRDYHHFDRNFATRAYYLTKWAYQKAAGC